MAALSWYKWHWQDWRANRRVQRMPWRAKGPYRELLDEFWAEGSLPVLMRDLADIVGCSEAELTELWPYISPCFEERDGRLYNAKMDEQRTAKDAERVSKAVAGGKGGRACNSKTRAEELEAEAKQEQASAKEIQAQPDIEEERRGEESRGKKNSSRGKREEKEVDPRHEGCRAAVMAYGAFKNVKLPWDGSEAKTLCALLASLPELTLMEFQSCLNHRARSPGTPHGERPRIWLPNITRYQQGPLTQFNRTEDVSNGTFKGKTESSVDAAKQAIEIIRARGQADRNRILADEAGYPPAGEAGDGRLLGDGGGFEQV